MRTQAVSFWIDRATGDLLIDRDTGFVALATGTDEVEQGIRRRLEMWQGEWFWDGRDGVPWHYHFGKRFEAERLQLEILAELHRDPRLDRILDLRVSSFDPQTRAVTIIFAAAFQEEIVKGTLRVGYSTGGEG